MDILKNLKLELDTDSEPLPDMLRCCCGWVGEVSECPTEEDGDWETGYVTVHCCPVCEDGGADVEYFMSEERAYEWEQWRKRRERR